MRRSARFSLRTVAKGGVMKADFAGVVAVEDRAAVKGAENFAVAADAAADSIRKGIPAVLRRPLRPQRNPSLAVNAPAPRASERPLFNRVPSRAAGEAQRVRQEAAAAAVAVLEAAVDKALERRAEAPVLLLILPCGPVRASEQRTPVPRVRPVDRAVRALAHRVRPLPPGR